MTNRFIPRALGPLMALTLATAAPWAQADADMPMQGMNPMQMQQAQMGAGWGYGPGYGMGGYGPGMGQGYGMGPGGMMGMGPGMGMMGGMGYGGSMGGYGPGMGMGPGMMGMGHGMMGGSGMGMGMGFGRMGHLWMLDLSDEQSDKIDAIRDEVIKKQRGLMQQIWTEQDRLRELYAADKRDPAAIGKVYGKVGELQRQAFMNHLEAEKRMEEVLTKEQKAQLQRGFRRWGMMGY